MNLHGIVSPYVGAVNPQIPVTVQISSGPSTPDAANGFVQTPTFSTPGAITAAITAMVLTVSAVASGKLEPGQTLAGAGLRPNTQIVSQLTGTPGGIGTYQLDQLYDTPVTSESMTTALVLLGQVQPLSTRDLAQLDGINQGGVHWKIYLNGALNGVVRPELKGGDLLAIASGPHQGVWLVTQVLEQFPDWCCAAITLQNQS